MEEVEILFKNSFVRNKEVLKEVYRYYYFQRWYIILCFVLLGISFIINVFCLIFYGVGAWSIIILVPLFVLFSIIRYFRQINTIVKREKETTGEETAVEIIVTDNYMQGTASSGSVIKPEYSAFKNGHQTKNLILLRSKANLVYVFRKDSFTLGTAPEFIEFLKGKGIKVK